MCHDHHTVLTRIPSGNISSQSHKMFIILLKNHSK